MLARDMRRGQPHMLVRPRLHGSQLRIGWYTNSGTYQNSVDFAHYFANQQPVSSVCFAKRLAEPVAFVDSEQQPQCVAFFDSEQQPKCVTVDNPYREPNRLAQRAAERQPFCASQ